MGFGASNRFDTQFRKPRGFRGKLLIRGMNAGHRRLYAWGLAGFSIPSGERVLDVGCGGGEAIRMMLDNYPGTVVDGVDYSADCVAMSRNRNKAYLGSRTTICEGDVLALPFADSAYDVVTPFETIYFWPDLDVAFSQIARVLSPGGRFLIVCESGDPSENDWERRIEGMKIHTPTALKDRLSGLGFLILEDSRRSGSSEFRIIAQKRMNV
ncbi:MAG: class I SAM-dependent methyltransferase [Sphaerochaetaceae bacterium]|jgi:ubiquinone/menaquinone biosynthesis C-methylase UbiE